MAGAVLTANITGARELGELELNRLDQVLVTEVEAGRIPGAVSLVAQEGRILRVSASGHLDLENRVLMTGDTLFRIYSMSKPITGTALMILYEQGKFSLDDPVAKFIPAFGNLRVAQLDRRTGSYSLVPADRSMTMQELITHTAGLVYITPYSSGHVADLYARQDVLNTASSTGELIAKLSRLPLAFQPGTKQEYSLAVDVQGYLIELFSGMPLDAFLTEKIYAPLQMHDTGFHVPEEEWHRFSRRYTPSKDDVLTSNPNQRFLTKPSMLSGGNGLVSTAYDYFRFAQMHLNGGELDGVRVISQQTAELMHDMPVPGGVELQQFYPGSEFRGHFATVIDGSARDGLPVGSYWWWGLVGTWFWVDPKSEVVVVVMTQVDDFPYTRSLTRASRKAVYDPPIQRKAESSGFRRR